MSLLNMAVLLVFLMSFPALILCFPSQPNNEKDDFLSETTFMNGISLEKNTTFYSGSKYFVSSTSADWPSAEFVCVLRNMRLATVNNQQENDRLYSIMKEHGINWLWVGATDLGEEGRYSWLSTKAALEYNNWDESQPDNHGGKEHCMEMRYYYGKWNDRECSTMNRFACEVYEG